MSFLHHHTRIAGVYSVRQLHLLSLHSKRILHLAGLLRIIQLIAPRDHVEGIGVLHAHDVIVELLGSHVS